MVRLFLAVVLIVSLSTAFAHAAGFDDLDMITPAELKARLDAGERIVILDVRSSGAYASSELRVKGDTRIAPDELVDRAWELPMGAEIVTYCT